MAKVMVVTLWILISMFSIVFVTDATGQTTDHSFDSVSNQTNEVFTDIPDLENSTKESFGNDSNERKKVSRTVDSSRNVSSYWERNVTMITKEQMKNCSIVVGIALAGGFIAPIALGFGIPLVLCVLGFTCWGIMAGSAAACCQSSIGDVPKGSCFACCQSIGAGGGMICILCTACMVGVPIGIGLGGYIANTYFKCF